ncbi:MAG: aspartate--ammonia ligase [Patescibacteria group bacterium]
MPNGARRFPPDDYRPKLDLRETEIAIKLLKDFFELRLARALNLTRVSAPLIVRPETGLNDNLNGVERPVAFGIKDLGEAPCEIVQSLAKWKRLALARYGFRVGEGLYTDMNAIRRDEVLDNLHSIYVDQWDWEIIIPSEARTMETLHGIVRRIYGVFQETEAYILGRYPALSRKLPGEIHFTTAQELEDRYPGLSPREREDEICREKGAVFLAQIGGPLRSGARHDGRAPDYDDWSLNGDIIFYYPLLGMAFEVSSMGIRVDAAALDRQLRLAGCDERRNLPFHRALLEGGLPQTAGGGIGQSRICQFFLDKAHIGEVQASVWPEETLAACEAAGVTLL